MFECRVENMAIALPSKVNLLTKRIGSSSSFDSNSGVALSPDSLDMEIMNTKLSAVKSI